MSRFDGFDGLITKHFGQVADDAITEKLEGAGYHVKGLSGSDLAAVMASVDWTKLNEPTDEQAKRKDTCGIEVKVQNPTPPPGFEADADKPDMWGDYTNLRFHVSDVAKALDDLAESDDYEPKEMMKIQARLLRAVKADKPPMADCPECGKPIPEGTEKCPHCGVELTWEDGKPADDDGNDDSKAKAVDEMGIIVKAAWTGDPHDDEIEQAVAKALDVVQKVGQRHSSKDQKLVGVIHHAATELGYNDCVPKSTSKGGDTDLLRKHVTDLSTDLASLRVEKDGTSRALTQATTALTEVVTERDELRTEKEELERQKAALLRESQEKTARIKELEERAGHQLPSDPLKRKSVEISQSDYSPEPEGVPVGIESWLNDLRQKGL